MAEFVPSQWGPVHLFDLCLWFGFSDTALALALGGVTGCTLEDHHLGALPGARDTEVCVGCRCEGWKACSRCCWGFPLENGIWMKDWDAKLLPAADAAMEAAKKPLVRGILEIASRDERLPLAMSEAAAVRLLDIAILIGNVEAATNLAKTCKARPLRRWRGNEMYPDQPTIFAALFADADFEGLHVYAEVDKIPLLRLMALDFEPDQWEQLGQFFLAKKNQWPTCDIELGHYFLKEGCVSMQVIQNALKAGWDLKRIWTELAEDREYCEAGLLDLAVLCGQPDCAGALGSAGVELKVDCLDLRRRAFCRDDGRALQIRFFEMQVCALRSGSVSECKSAASAAARAFLMNSFKREGVEKGIALYQMLAKKFCRRHFPMALVHDILGFSMERPKILDQLDHMCDLWDDMKGWMPWLRSLHVAAQGDDANTLVDLNVDDQTGMDVDGEPGTLGLCQQHALVCFRTSNSIHMRPNADSDIFRL